MRQLTLVAVCGLFLLSIGCSGAARLDASSDDALKKSLEKMTAGMTDEQKKQFLGDCMAVVLPEAMKNAFQDAFKKDKQAEPATSSKLFKPLDGMTVGEIHDRAESARAQMRDKK